MKFIFCRYPISKTNRFKRIFLDKLETSGKRCQIRNIQKKFDFVILLHMFISGITFHFVSNIESLNCHFQAQISPPEESLKENYYLKLI